MFLLSVDEPTPIYLKDKNSNHVQSSLAFGDTILVIQNQQNYISQKIQCGNKLIYDNLRNPLGITLRSLGSIFLGMYSAIIDDPLTPEHHDIRSTIVSTYGSSPYYGSLSGRTPIFNQFDMVSSLLLRPSSLPSYSLLRKVVNEVDYFVP